MARRTKTRRDGKPLAKVGPAPSRASLLLEPLVLGTNLGVAAWVCPCIRTARIRWSPGLSDLDEAACGAGRTLIYYTWHANEMVGPLAFRDCPDRLMPVAIGHDGLASRMVHRATSWYGPRVWVYRRRSAIRPKEQIIGMVRETGCHIGLLADSGGPYGRVKRGLIDVARATGALLVPFTVRGRGVVETGWPCRYRVPLPFCALVVYRGEPVRGDEASLDVCQRALDEQESRASSSGAGRARRPAPA
jgi:lysophospholipid acyltransferase (LPLAT)-like uncharacterized protein